GNTGTVFQATKANFQELEVPGSFIRHWEALSMTVKDAILLTEKLEIPFLWVDRLCIVQDDENSMQHNIS
ncbi:uncharacterized protein BDZ99DRAFT_392516, partial [Mytilinidion resinicola]